MLLLEIVQIPQQMHPTALVPPRIHVVGPVKVAPQHAVELLTQDLCHHLLPTTAIVDVAAHRLPTCGCAHLLTDTPPTPSAASRTVCAPPLPLAGSALRTSTSHTWDSTL